MNLPLFAIRRHVLTTALAVVILLGGLVAFTGLPLDRMPKVEVPALTVITALSGADPETVAKSVTTPLESLLNTISGVDTMTSVSGTGISTITLSFNADKDMDEALSDVQTKLERARRGLPDEADSPYVLKFDLNAQPVVRLMLTSDIISIERLTPVATQVQRRIESILGVGEVQLSGTREETLKVTLDETALIARGLTIQDVAGAVARNHLQPAGGKARLPGRDFALKLDFEVATPEAIGEITVGLQNGVPVRLRDVAQLSFSPSDSRQYARFNGVPGIAISVTKADDANAVELVRAVIRRMDELRSILPEGVRLDVAAEESGPIQEVVDALRDHLIEGTLLTAFIIWVFLKNWRATIIIATAIPVSLLGAVAAFQVLDYTLNSFTLLALLLLIGIVVDDAIVVLENIYRVQESEGLAGEDAAAEGSRGVLFAVAASTLTLVSIFAPIMYLDGVLGQVFLPFAAIVTIGVLVSWLVAVTLTPMLCAHHLRHEDHEGRIASALERSFRAVEAAYGRSLEVALRHRKLVIVGALATVLPAVALLGSIEKGFIPTQDTGRLDVRVELPAGMPVDVVEQTLKRAEDLVNSVPEVTDVLATFRESSRNGTPSASLSVTLSSSRERPQAEILRDMNARLRTLDGARAIASASQAGGGGPGLQFSLSGPSLESVAAAAAPLLDRLRESEILSGLRSNLDLSSPQATLEINRMAAGVRGISAQDIGQAVSTMTGQLNVGYYTGEDGERHEIRLAALQSTRDPSLENILSAHVKGADGAVFPLAEVVDFKVQGAAAAVTRVSQRYAVTFSGSPNGSMGEAMALVDEAAKELPEGLSIMYSGQSEEFRKLGRSIGLVLVASALLLYLVMASQFNSYRQPGIIMLAQPLAAIGGIGALWLTGHSLNIYSMVGLVLLVGLTAKTGILLVDRANQLQAGLGLAAREAMLQAAPERLRPILMTALTVVTSLTPAALGLGPGAENNGPLAIAVIGGMLSATALTLYVIPVAYLGILPRRKAL